MIKYTFKDVQALADEIALYFHDKDTQSWHETVDKIKEEYSEIKEIILEFLGPYVFAFNREFSKKIGLTDLIFNTPIEKMPLYIGSEDEPWDMIVARWRLSIQK